MFRAQAGVRAIKLPKPRAAGAARDCLAAALLVDDGEQVVMASRRGVVVRQSVDAFAVQVRAGGGREAGGRCGEREGVGRWARCSAGRAGMFRAARGRGGRRRVVLRPPQGPYARGTAVMGLDEGDELVGAVRAPPLPEPAAGAAGLDGRSAQARAAKAAEGRKGAVTAEKGAGSKAAGGRRGPGAVGKGPDVGGGAAAPAVKRGRKVTVAGGQAGKAAKE
jgi:hypothetical protein